MADISSAGGRERRPLSPAPAWLLLGCGVAAMIFYLMVPAVAAYLVFGMAAVSIAALIVGLRRNEAEAQRRRPWYALAIGMAVFLLGAVLRVVVPGATANPPGLNELLVDASVLPGYVCVAYGLLDMLRRRRGTADRLARTDGLLIGLGAAVGTWSLWLAPRIESHLYGAPQLVATVYPLVDVIVLVLVIRLMAADGVRQPSLWLLMLTMGLMFTIDLIYAMFAETASPALLAMFDLGFMLGYVTLGAAALHPTMRSLGEPQRMITKTIGAARIAGIAAVVVAPTICAYIIPASSLWNRSVRVALAALLAVTIIRRIVRSQASQADAEAAAMHRSTHDMLTELPNRELLTDTITAWCDRSPNGTEISLLFIDLDRFKQVNDNWGHRVGDELLCAVAGRLAAMVRSTDIVCRIGGDEFVIALASSSHEALAESLAGRIVEDFKAPFPLSVGPVFVAPSIGVVLAHDTAEALESIRDADLAMYQAKDSGGNTFAVFDDSLRDRAHTRVEMEQALRGALGRGELSVHYQPLVNAATCELSGFEALMRWTHPSLGVVPPDKFIPVAEQTGLIIPAGRWILDEAIDQLARWQRDREPGLPPLHMSINIATRQLRDPDLVDVVRRALQRSGVPPATVWLEITESALLKDTEQSVSTLEELRDLGALLCLDDFGTGYASLSYIREIPASIIKIDKRFVDGIGVDASDEAIVIAVVAMAHAVSQEVVAEGVETAEQWRWLTERGCDVIQGWLFGRPLPASTQDAWRKHMIEPILPVSAART
jgi:diguanylate cyclase (GGDEF)-like protein